MGPIDRRLSCRKSAPAVILTIHAQLARANGGLRIPRPKIPDYRSEPMCGRQTFKYIVAYIEKLVRRHGQGGGDAVKPLPLGHTTCLSQAQRIACTAAALAVKRTHTPSAPLPQLPIVTRNYKWKAHLVAPAAKLGQSSVVLGHRLDVRVGPADSWLKPLLHQQANRLERTRRTTGMQQQSSHGSPCPSQPSRRPRPPQSHSCGRVGPLARACRSKTPHPRPYPRNTRYRDCAVLP